ncbi:hypothetical protein [Enterococcus cecorum]|uniref:hypothetical protein n=1 Tax=Enterococcus cecorum TaxID=44008 RepID=UPI00148BC0CA|nr:hypothetical protein [Enterococcus cecorum]
MDNDIIKIFWTNVDKYRRKRCLTWEDLIKSRDARGCIRGTKNVTLKTVQYIAEKLRISDYTILFERVDG